MGPVVEVFYSTTSVASEERSYGIACPEQRSESGRKTGSDPSPTMELFIIMFMMHLVREC